MCNLYSVTSTQQAIRELVRAWKAQDVKDKAGNLPSLPGIYPDTSAPIIRLRAEGPELATARWGMPSPPAVIAGRKTDPGVTNIRNLASPHWRRWLGPEHRCLVPFNSFAEHTLLPDGSRPPIWFALAPDRPLAFFAGIQARWTSIRKVKDGETTDDLFAFLTTTPNAEVAAIHPKAMPVILTDPADWATWLDAPIAEASRLQRPLPDNSLQIVARGPKQDSPDSNNPPHPAPAMLAPSRVSDGH